MFLRHTMPPIIARHAGIKVAMVASTINFVIAESAAFSVHDSGVGAGVLGALVLGALVLGALVLGALVLGDGVGCGVGCGVGIGVGCEVGGIVQQNSAEQESQFGVDHESQR